MKAQAPYILLKIAKARNFISTSEMKEAIESEEKYEGNITVAKEEEILRQNRILSEEKIEEVKRSYKFLQSRSQDLRFGEIALRNDLISRDEFHEALNRQKDFFEQKKKIIRLPALLVKQGILTEDQADRVRSVKENMAE